MSVGTGLFGNILGAGGGSGSSPLMSAFLGGGSDPTARNGFNDRAFADALQVGGTPSWEARSPYEMAPQAPAEEAPQQQGQGFMLPDLEQSRHMQSAFGANQNPFAAAGQAAGQATPLQ